MQGLLRHPISLIICDWSAFENCIRAFVPALDWELILPRVQRLGWGWREERKEPNARNFRERF